jgi:hypothetical protein
LTLLRDGGLKFDIFEFEEEEVVAVFRVSEQAR